MAVAGGLMKCVCLWTKQSAFMARKGFVSIGSLATIAQPEVGRRQPLRMVCRSMGSLRAETEFPRPSTVSYEKNLANSVNFIGSVGVNPNIQYQDSGEIVATSSLSVKKAPPGEPSWFFLEFRNDLAEIAVQHVRKGDRIYVAGSLIVESLSLDPETEQNQTLVKVVVSKLHFVDDVSRPQTQPLSKRSSFGSVEKKQAAEKSWKLFFENPRDWYDNRENKRNPRAPDFKHKTSGEGLWIQSFYIPSFVAEKIEELENEGVLNKVDKPASSTESSESIGVYQAF